MHRQSEDLGGLLEDADGRRMQRRHRWAGGGCNTRQREDAGRSKDPGKPPKDAAQVKVGQSQRMHRLSKDVGGPEDPIGPPEDAT